MALCCYLSLYIFQNSQYSSCPLQSILSPGYYQNVSSRECGWYFFDFENILGKHNIHLVGKPTIVTYFPETTLQYDYMMLWKKCIEQLQN